MQSNPVNQAGAWGLGDGLSAGSASPCRAPGLLAMSRGCYQGCHLGFLLRQAGWRRALAQCRPSGMAALHQLCLLLPTLARTDLLGGSLTNQLFAPRNKASPLCWNICATQRVLLDTMIYTQAPHHYEQPLPCAAGSAQFSRIHQHRLSERSLSECCFTPSGGNFALITSKLDPSSHEKVGKEATGIVLPVAATPLAVVRSMG